MGRTIRHTHNSIQDESPPPDIHHLARQRFQLEAQIAQLKARSTHLRDRLLEVAEHHGRVDEHGHQRVYLDSPVTVGDKTYTGFVRRRSVTQSFNEDAARELVEARGLTDRVTKSKMITWIDQDELWACQQEGLLTAAEIDALIDRTYTHSLWGTS
ncbi:hypothetical protein AB0G15_05475 [Streptosporangium sp. NPDC023825]|uniref:hypothetical protein n=1 Tax=Streptosporangium sp. NPDC023825 TaxID=3154909 RepID=UPI00343300FF